MTEMRLVIRTPTKTMIDRSVVSVTAEDRTGRFGIRPRMEPIIAALVPSLLTYRTGDGDHWVAVGRGVVRTRSHEVRVSVRCAIPCASLDAVEAEVERVQQSEDESDATTRAAFRSLFARLQQSLLDQERSR